eukprot:360870-Chlamydomonas_euryale.AAC.12
MPSRAKAAAVPTPPNHALWAAAAPARPGCHDDRTAISCALFIIERSLPPASTTIFTAAMRPRCCPRKTYACGGGAGVTELGWVKQNPKHTMWADTLANADAGEGRDRAGRGGGGGTSPCTHAGGCNEAAMLTVEAMQRTGRLGRHTWQPSPTKACVLKSTHIFSVARFPSNVIPHPLSLAPLSQHAQPGAPFSTGPAWRPFLNTPSPHAFAKPPSPIISSMRTSSRSAPVFWMEFRMRFWLSFSVTPVTCLAQSTRPEAVAEVATAIVATCQQAQRMHKDKTLRPIRSSCP